MYSVSCACIAFVALVILSSTIRLETQREKKQYGILQALGMSRRQRNLRLIGTALARSVTSVALGWGVCKLYAYIKNTGAIVKESTVSIIPNSYMSGIAPVILTVVLFIVIFLICYISKSGLNKYTLMEMLRDDR